MPAGTVSTSLQAVVTAVMWLLLPSWPCHHCCRTNSLHSPDQTRPPLCRHRNADQKTEQRRGVLKIQSLLISAHSLHYLSLSWEALTLTPNSSSPVQREPYKGCKSQFCVQITPNNPGMITHSVFSDTLLQSASPRQGWPRYGSLHKLFSLLNCPVESWSVWDWNVPDQGPL